MHSKIYSHKKAKTTYNLECREYHFVLCDEAVDGTFKHLFLHYTSKEYWYILALQVSDNLQPFPDLGTVPLPL